MSKLMRSLLCSPWMALFEYLRHLKHTHLVDISQGRCLHMFHLALCGALLPRAWVWHLFISARSNQFVSFSFGRCREILWSGYQQAKCLRSPHRAETVRQIAPVFRQDEEGELPTGTGSNLLSVLVSTWVVAPFLCIRADTWWTAPRTASTSNGDSAHVVLS